MSDIYIYDPTKIDALSKVRGVGRFLQILHENLSDVATFTSDIKKVPSHSLFINPFFDFLKPPLFYKRIAHKQAAVIHDVIRLKYPEHFPRGLKGNIYTIINNLIFSTYDVIITDSEQSKKDIIEILNIPEEKIHVIYLTVPRLFHEGIHSGETDILTKLSIAKNNFCLYVGDITWNKNIINLAKALKQTNLKCVFAGKSFLDKTNLDHREKDDFRTFLKIVENDDRFIFTGYISDEDLITLYKNTRLNVLPSYDEGFGLSYLESAIYGTPSVLSDIPVFKEIAQDSAVFAHAEDPQDIAKKLEILFDDDALHIEISEKARKRAQFFSQEQFRKQFIKISQL